MRIWASRRTTSTSRSMAATGQPPVPVSDSHRAYRGERLQAHRGWGSTGSRSRHIAATDAFIFAAFGFNGSRAKP